MARELAAPEAAAWQRRAATFWAVHDANAGPVPLDLDARRDALLADLELAYCAGAWTAVVLVGWALGEELDRQRPPQVPPAPDLEWLRSMRNVWAHGGAADIDAVALSSLADGALRVVFRHLFAAAWR